MIKKYYTEISCIIILLIGFIGMNLINSNYLTIEDGEYEQLAEIAKYIVTSAY